MAKMENRRYCDICGVEIPAGVLAFIHWDYLYCPKCEEIHRSNIKHMGMPGSIGGIPV